MKNDGGNDNCTIKTNKLIQILLLTDFTVKKKGKVHPCTGTESLYRPYGP